MNRTDIPAIVRRARFVQGLTQAQLAEAHNVHPTTVARWETGKMSPSPSILRDLYRSLVQANPLWLREYLESSMVPRYIHHIDDQTVGLLVSEGMATVFGSTKEKLLQDFLPWGGSISLELYKQARQDPNFAKAHHIEAVFPHVADNGLWWHARAIFIDDAHSVLWEGALLPHGDGPSIKIVTHRDMADTRFAEVVRLEILHKKDRR